METEFALEFRESLKPWRRFKRRNRWAGFNPVWLGLYVFPRVTLLAWLLRESGAWAFVVTPLSMIWGAAAIFAAMIFLFSQIMGKRGVVGAQQARSVSAGMILFAASGIALMFGLIPYAFALVIVAEAISGDWKKKRTKTVVSSVGRVCGAAAGFVPSVPLLGLGVVVDALSLLIRPWRLESIVRSKPSKEEFIQERSSCSVGGG